MGLSDIAFPNLGIYLEQVPKSFTIFNFSIAFYGVIIGIGVFAGLMMAVREAKLTGQDPEIYWDFSIYGIISAIIGARLYFVIFSWDYYKDNLLSILNLREGGLAIYGGVIAAFITLLLYCKWKKQSFFQMGDTAVLGLILGQVIGRWGNFMNREAFGGYTEGLFAMRIPIEAVRGNDISADIAAHIVEGTNYIQVHPTFLYESLWNLVLLVAILLYRKHKKFQGELVVLYLGGYGLGRFWIEGLRTDQLWIPGTQIAVSQVLAILLVGVAIACELFVRIRVKKKKKVTEE